MQQILYYSQSKDPAIDWIFKIFSTVIGCRFCSITEPQLASVVYANMMVTGEQFHIPFWSDYYESNITHCLNRSGYWVPVTMQDTETRIDYVGLVFRLISLTDELVIGSQDRDQLGNLASSECIQRMEFYNRPMVDEIIQDMKKKLVKHGLLREDELLPRWPDGKRFAVLLTHDTDGPCLLEPGELTKAGLKGFIKANRTERGAFFEGCRRLLIGHSDPYFNFARWANFEQELGIKSTFYIYMKDKSVPDHIHNPLYKVKKSTRKWSILRELVDGGWEIGLHASIHALAKDGYIQTEKSNLEDFLGKQIVGNRCHYWHINWQNPAESLQRLEAAGITYDCSIAWKDRPGFRSGTVTPYHPYASQDRSVLNLLEIPTNVMDGHLFEYHPEINPYAKFISIVKQVRLYRGVLNLDWHTRTWVDQFSYAGWRSFLVQELQKLATTEEVWFTTPGELSEYWQLREQQLAGG